MFLWLKRYGLAVSAEECGGHIVTVVLLFSIKRNLLGSSSLLHALNVAV